MEGLYEEHDALIVAAAAGILQRVAGDALDRAAAARGSDGIRYALVAEAASAAQLAATMALRHAGALADDEKARKALRDELAGEPAPGPVAA